MRILKIIHGYPPQYNAGSEVYSQQLCQALADRHEVEVLTREEDLLRPDYAVRRITDATDIRIPLHLLNLPRSRHMNRYQHAKFDEYFEKVLAHFRPHIIHIGHLNHLSTSIVSIAAARQIPIIYTLHDFWLPCPRGQFIQRNSNPPWALCEKQEDGICATNCYAGEFSGGQDQEEDIAHWTGWVHRRMEHVANLIQHVDAFVSPSRYLQKRFCQSFAIDPSKMVYLDYGFDLTRLQNRTRVVGEPFTFGYIGTHIPAKGIQDLLLAFAQLQGQSILRIWGRSSENTKSLKMLTQQFPKAVQQRIQWRNEYANHNLINEVFNHVDAIVVPSIWGENSPLVIHEAQQARIPVLTANMGGMAEYVAHEVNGLLFKPRDHNDLAKQMQRLLDNPRYAAELGRKGYLNSPDGNIPDMPSHVSALERLYHEVLEQRGAPYPKQQGPWRITFDTNPDHCNYRCTMCECFSPYSQTQKDRQEAGIARRIMPFATIQSVIESVEGTDLREIIPSTMGEPLLYEDFDKLIDLCHKHHLKLNLTTNGSFPRKGVEAWATKLVPVSSDVKISWNGATKETHEQIMLGAKWEEVCRNLRIFTNIRDTHAASGGNFCRVTLQMTFLESNVHELTQLVYFAADMGVNRIKGHHLWAHFKQIEHLSMRRSTESIARWNNAVLSAQHAVKHIAKESGHHIILENIEVLAEDAVNNLDPDGVCPFLGNEAWVNTEGKFSPCCAPDKERERLGDFGNVHAQSILQIWQSQPYQDLRKDYQQHGLCQGCNMRKALEVYT